MTCGRSSTPSFAITVIAWCICSAVAEMECPIGMRVMSIGSQSLTRPEESRTSPPTGKPELAAETERARVAIEPLVTERHAELRGAAVAGIADDFGQRDRGRDLETMIFARAAEHAAPVCGCEIFSSVQSNIDRVEASPSSSAAATATILKTEPGS